MLLLVLGRHPKYYCLLLRYLVGLNAEDANTITIAPALPQSRRRVGASYRVEHIPWGKYVLNVECRVKDAKSYYMQVRCLQEVANEYIEGETTLVEKHMWDWEGAWGDGRTFPLDH